MSGGQQPLVLSLLPIERGQLAAGEPAVDRRPDLGLVAKARREGELPQLDAEAAPQLLERAELVQLEQPVRPVPRARSARDDQPVWAAASPTVACFTAGTLTHLCQGSLVPVLP